MLYLLFVLTFLCGILFYGMSPSDKSLDMTVHQAEGMIVSFINQHQAAKDYLYTWLGVAPATSGDSEVRLNEEDGIVNLRSDSNANLNPDFEEMELSFKKNGKEFGLMSDMCAGNTGVPGQNTCQDEYGKQIPGFISKIVCTNSDGSAVTGCRNVGAKHYVMTYGGWEECKSGDKDCCKSEMECDAFKRPAWWPRPGNRMRRFESWRKAMALRTRGSVSCGTLVKVGGNWCIDNGETVYKNESTAPKTCMNQVPTALISQLPYTTTTDNGKDDLLFCYSEFKQGVKPGHYAVAPTHFYDGLSNAGVGQHINSNEEQEWVDLVGSHNLTGFHFNENPYVIWANPTAGYVFNSGFKNTGILLGNNYTLTVLLSIPAKTKFNIFQVASDATSTAIDTDTFSSKPIFYKSDTEYNGKEVFRLNYLADGSVVINGESAYNNPSTIIISWTFVVEGTNLDVYENGVKKDWFSDKTIPSTNGKYLLLGTPDASGVHIYGIRYYGSSLTPEQIQKNFKVDQKRFGISDVNNGGTESTVHVEHEEVE